MSAVPGIAIAGMVVFAAASFFFALAESALFSLGRWRTQQMAEKDAESGRRVAELLSNPQDLLAAIVLGNTLANAGLIGTALWQALEGSWPLLETVAAMVVVVLVVCEMAPKTLAVRAPELWARRLAGSILVFRWMTQPVRRIAQYANSLLVALIPKSIKPIMVATDEEYQELLEIAFQQGALAKSEKEILVQIITLDRRMARDVMKPRSQMACIADTLSIEEMMAESRRLRHHRLPIYDETPDTIVGILNTRNLLLNPEIDLSESIEFPSFVPETMNLLQLFKSFQRQRREMAIVLDEFGGTAGIVTMEDILGEVVGRLHGEETEQEVFIEKKGEGKWRVSGLMRLDDFRRECPTLPEEASVNTIGGLALEAMGHVPNQGESVVHGGLKLTATGVDERRIYEVTVEVVRKKGGLL